MPKRVYPFNSKAPKVYITPLPEPEDIILSGNAELHNSGLFCRHENSCKQIFDHLAGSGYPYVEEFSSEEDNKIYTEYSIKYRKYLESNGIFSSSCRWTGD